MKIHFEPKIIIGSVFGFIASLIGLIAIFFPSIFNLEKESIKELTISLDNNNNFLKLYTFLNENQGKFVRLSLVYKETNRRYAIEYTDFFEKDKKKIIDPIKEKIIPSFGIANITNQAIVLSSLAYSNNLMREKGAIGIWVSDISNDNEIPYEIIIPVRSDNSLLYKWFLNSGDDRDTMELSGTFFVNKILDDSAYIGKIPYTMPKLFLDEKCQNNRCPTIKIIILDPISKKELLEKNL